MPDFEALIRNQQLKQPTNHQRLKIVDTPDYEKERNEKTTIAKSGFIGNFFGGLIGSIVGTFTIFFLYINEYLPIDLLKLK